MAVASEPWNSRLLEESQPRSKTRTPILDRIAVDSIAKADSFMEGLSVRMHSWIEAATGQSSAGVEFVSQCTAACVDFLIEECIYPMRFALCDSFKKGAGISECREGFKSRFQKVLQ